MNARERVEVEGKKIMIPSPFPAILWIVSICQGKYWQKQKNEERKIEKKYG